jgi:hypothetical protein
MKRSYSENRRSNKKELKRQTGKALIIRLISNPKWPP